MSDQPPLIDSHAHVVPSVYGDELPEVLQRASDAGVTQIVCIGSGYGADSAGESVVVADQYEQVFATVGIHPHDAKHVDDGALEMLSDLAGREKVVAWGEIGLDYHYDNSPRDVQRRAFAEQLEAARAVDLPVVIHTREADDDTVAILDEHDSWGRGVLIHCFSHTPAFARELLERGAILSIPGIVTFKKATDLQEAVRQIPLERMMVETDSPFLSPIPYRGKRNEPAYVRRVAEFVAELKGTTVEAVSAATVANTRQFFGLPNN